jgi:GntR family transcriptional regulator
MNTTITIDFKSPIPVYRQIADALRHLLVNGELQPGDQVPTVRQLALDLNVHFNTVAQAYRVLSDEGWLDLKRRRGATVLDRRKPAVPSKERQKQALQRLRELTAQLQSEGIPVTQIASQLRKLADTLVEGE